MLTEPRLAGAKGLAGAKSWRSSRTEMLPDCDEAAPRWLSIALPIEFNAKRRG